MTIMCLPAWIVKRVDLSPTRRKIVGNVLWLVLDKMVSLVDACLVGALVARHLGPTAVGTMSYSASVVGIFLTIANLGLDSLVVSKFVKSPESRGRLLWNATYAKLFLAILFFIAIVAFATMSHADDGLEAIIVMAITAVSLLLSPLSNFRLLLEAEVASKWSVWINNSALVLSAAARLCLVAVSAGLIPFVAVTVAAAIISATGVAFITARLGLVPRPERPSLPAITALVRESWPLLLTALSVYLYLNVDLLLLKWFGAPSDAGIYSVATRLSSVWYFVPLVLSSSLLPSLTAIRDVSPDLYFRRLQWYFDISACAALLSTVTAIVVFPPLIRFLFGADFHESVSVFVIHVWALPFVFLGVARTQHLVIEGRHRFNLFATQAGLVANLLLNLFLIPAYGCRGSAVSTLFSFAVAAYFSTFCLRSLWPIGVLQTKALFTSPWRLLRQPIV